MPTDDERRRVAERLRACTPTASYTSAQGGGWSHLCDMALAVGLTREDEPSAWMLANRLADLIEPSESVKCIVKVDVDGERLKDLAYKAAVECAGVDREALLALADGLEADADRIIKAAKNARFGVGPRMSEAKLDADEWRSIARRIREACGEVVE